MGEPLIIVISIVAFIIFIFIIRAIGAWMLRIDEIIKNQKSMVDELKEMNKTLGRSSKIERKND